MRKTVLAILAIGGMAVWGQAPKEASPSADRAGKATAYYHFMLAHFYSEMAGTPRDRNGEYADKATENYKDALKADPHAPDPAKYMPPLFYVRPIPAPPASQNSK